MKIDVQSTQLHHPFGNMASVITIAQYIAKQKICHHHNLMCLKVVAELVGGNQ
jgi:hypothetical protein